MINERIMYSPNAQLLLGVCTKVIQYLLTECWAWNQILRSGSRRLVDRFDPLHRPGHLRQPRCTSLDEGLGMVSFDLFRTFGDLLIRQTSLASSPALNRETQRLRATREVCFYCPAFHRWPVPGALLGVIGPNQTPHRLHYCFKIIDFARKISQ
jgi:hypothetical protein